MEEKLFREEKRGGYVIKYYYDDKAIPPRKQEPIGTIYSVHKDLDPDGHRLAELFSELNAKSYSYDALKEVLDKDYYYVEIDCYEHCDSIKIYPSTHLTHMNWDSHFFGIILLRKDEMEKYGFTSSEQVIKCLKGEIKAYDAYQSGEVYKYRIFDETGNIVSFMSHFYDMDIMEEYIARDIKNDMEHKAQTK